MQNVFLCTFHVLHAMHGDVPGRRNPRICGQSTLLATPSITMRCIYILYWSIMLYYIHIYIYIYIYIICIYIIIIVYILFIIISSIIIIYILCFVYIYIYIYILCFVYIYIYSQIVRNHILYILLLRLHQVPRLCIRTRVFARVLLAHFARFCWGWGSVWWGELGWGGGCNHVCLHLRSHVMLR